MTERTQINIRLTPGEMDRLRILAEHYGSTAATVRVALDDLWDKYIRGRQELASIKEDAIHQDGDAGNAPG